jgi:hypothetical protein
VFLLNAPFGPNRVWDHLPRKAQQQIIEQLRVSSSTRIPSRAKPAWAAINASCRPVFAISEFSQRAGHRGDQESNQGNLRRAGRPS